MNSYVGTAPKSIDAVREIAFGLGIALDMYNYMPFERKRRILDWNLIWPHLFRNFFFQKGKKFSGRIITNEKVQRLCSFNYNLLKYINDTLNISSS